MSGITLLQAQTGLDNAIAAQTRVYESQEYKIGGYENKKAELRQISADIKYWDQKVQRLSRGGIRVRGATPA